MWLITDPGAHAHAHAHALPLAQVERVWLITDDGVKRDCGVPLNEDDYFVFTESVEDMVQCFLRDPHVLSLTKQESMLPLL